MDLVRIRTGGNAEYLLQARAEDDYFKSPIDSLTKRYSWVRLEGFEPAEVSITENAAPRLWWYAEAPPEILDRMDRMKDPYRSMDSLLLYENNSVFGFPHALTISDEMLADTSLQFYAFDGEYANIILIFAESETHPPAFDPTKNGQFHVLFL